MDDYEAMMREQYGQEAWDDYVKWSEDMEAKQERECGVGILFGPIHDPYGSSCELDRGHDGPHEGPGMVEDTTMRWTGGGSCDGDPLPFSLEVT
jgi:hypothetical protein